MAAALIAFPLLGLMGFIGTGQQRFEGERFVSRVMVVRPAGEQGVRITETVDVDFGPHFRHGYQRVIDHDFGIPTDVKATSTANPTLNIESEYGEMDIDAPPKEEPSPTDIVFGRVERRSPGFGETRIRVGSPDEVFAGTERYTLSYTLPYAQLGSGRLRLDIVDNEETLKTDRFEVVVDGFKMTNPTCSTGPEGLFGGCELVLNDDRTYRAVIAPLQPGDGITIGGDDVARADVSNAAITIPDTAPGVRPGWQVALILLAVEGAVVGLVYLVVSFVGANRVAAGGPTEAAFATAADGNGGGKVKTKRIRDDKLEELATIQFEPPAGVRPWQGAVLMNEQIDSRSVGAWVAEMIARGVLTVDGNKLRLASTDAMEGLEGDDLEFTKRLFAENTSFSTLFPPREVSKVWNMMSFRQETAIRKSGWWLKRAPTMEAREVKLGANWSVISFVGVIVLILMLIFHQAIVPMFYGIGYALSFLTAPIWSAIGITALGVGWAIWKLLRSMLPVRSVEGSAAALQVMSFRNFLTGSEGFHVDAAWDRDRIREYSAWAVALDAADAWAATLGEMGPTVVETASIGPTTLETMAERVASIIESAARAPDYSSNSLYRGQRADPWSTLFETIKNADWGSSSGSSWSSGGGGGGGGGRSSSVGGGGGGGHSGTW